MRIVRPPAVSVRISRSPVGREFHSGSASGNAHRSNATHLDPYAVDIDFDGGERKELAGPHRGDREHGNRNQARPGFSRLHTVHWQCRDRGGTMQLALLTIIFQSAGGQNPAKEDSGGLGLLTSDRDAFLLRPPMHILSGVDTT